MAQIELDLFLVILQQICWGSLISGLIIFFLTLILQGSHLFQHGPDVDHDFDHDVSLDHDVSVDHGISLDKDFSLDHDVSLDHGISLDKDFSLDHDVSLDHGISLDKEFSLDHDVSVDVDADIDTDLDIDHDASVGVDKHLGIDDHGVDTPAPLMLLLGTFMITFGGSGTVLIEAAIHPLILIVIIFGLPFGTTYAVSKIWEKIAVAEIYETALETIKADDPVKTLTTVDEKGGLVVIETSSIHGPVKMAAKTKFGAIARGMTAYVIEVQGNTLIIDEWSSTETEKKHIPEGTVKWE
ncbi:MAG: hypothetical protein JSW11_15600 [Candidatus Heimdallarchaeota archaeon]|nr:MAG: hypothetical protein JSW11_15600 [Candidatus Heimdallarchaeota archaeon]